MPIVTVDGVPVHYAAQGSGPRSIVFMHGGFGSSSELWKRTIAALPAGWRGYAIDNFLRSAPPPDGYSVQSLARRVRGFADALGLERPVIGGHSMGGVVTQLAASNDPERYAGAVLVCTGAVMTNHQLGHDLMAKLRETGYEHMREISSHWFRIVPADFFEGYVSRAMDAPLQAMLDVQQSLLDTDCRPLLPRIKAPTLVVFGAHDAGRTIEHAQTLLAGIPDSRLARMEDSGHSPMIETPADFDAALHAFLATV
ncbi:alpha/beta fold hydrolase [Xylophilus rhododendri]|uniref:Alpha/beta fold hydrolase n=1 Tax=Xylophilus rhododendri TaxID=2697032 RepID=A0A857J454_9BURK|nr:alpha/beta hydrolase [Xylophilus rhododendri]QHI97832.1 alpha/beta fold hydrolase [Xylophilus rhododendri]